MIVWMYAPGVKPLWVSDSLTVSGLVPKALLHKLGHLHSQHLGSKPVVVTHQTVK